MHAALLSARVLHRTLGWSALGPAAKPGRGQVDHAGIALRPRLRRSTAKPYLDLRGMPKRPVARYRILRLFLLCCRPFSRGGQQKESIAARMVTRLHPTLQMKGRAA
eukprot:scaffold1396_cov252-Pinguiococcus_pyrenoidosus.AAC.6